jgi:hypothetical protein
LKETSLGERLDAPNDRGGQMIKRLLFVGLAALAVAAPAAASECKPVNGTFTAVALPPFSAACPSFFCTQGTLVGDLNATYYFVADAPTPTGFTGHSTITTKNGVLLGQDVSVLFGPPVPGTGFETTVTIVGGTRKYGGASGTIVATGTLTATGTVGTYTGSICKSDEGDDD